MQTKKNIALLGATGSIGKNTLDVIRNDAEYFNPVLFSAHRGGEGLLSLAKEFPNAKIALSGANEDSPFLGQLDEIDQNRVYYGRQGLLNAISESGADIALNGIAGAAGLEPSLAVLESGADLALANKETMVMASKLVFKRARENEAIIIPVDSEHSAIFNLLNAHGRDALSEIILTASGGPFRNYTMEQLQNVKPQDALAHPTWSMGAKITIDSASLANKGLEVIEAAKLFDVAPDKIKVVVHPQSVVHSMARLSDGAVYAQLSHPDMRLPIHEALHYPELSPSPWGSLDFDHLALTFEKPDTARFPMLRFAYDALRAGGCYTIAYNAANEAAVAAFLAGAISFLDINRIVEYVLQKDFSGSPDELSVIRDADAKARCYAQGEL